jgi:hypothetical protein
MARRYLKVWQTAKRSTPRDRHTRRTVDAMSGQPPPDALSELLVRVASLRDGLLASTALPPEEAVREASLVLSGACMRSVRELTDVAEQDDDLTGPDLRLLLSAERYWLEILQDMLAAPDVPAGDRLDQVLAALPG